MRSEAVVSADSTSSRPDSSTHRPAGAVRRGAARQSAGVPVNQH